VTSNNGETQTVNFVPMSNGLCSLSDIYVEISTTVTQQGSDGQQTEKVQTKLETLAAVIQKRVLSLNPAMMTFSQIDFTPYVGRFGKTKHGVFNIHISRISSSPC
jgi:hypothetical protein